MTYIGFNYFILLFLFISTPLFGQEKSSKSLHFIVGEWRVENYSKEGDSWKNIGTTQSIARLEHDGRFVSERTKFLTSQGEINMMTFIGYDSKADRFKLTAMDKEYGLMDIYFGDWINGDLIFDNLKSDLPIKIQDGKELFFRVSYKDISKDQFTHWVEGTTDKGRTWFVFSKAEFKKTSTSQMTDKQPLAHSRFSISESDRKEIEALKKNIPLILANDGWEAYEKLFSKNYVNWHMQGDQVRSREDYLSAVKEWYEAGNKAVDSQVESIAFIPLTENKVMYLHKQVETFNGKEGETNNARDIRFIGIFVKENGQWKVDFTAYMDA